MELRLIAKLVDVNTCRAVLGRNEDYVLALVEDGSLELAFDLATARRRRLLRISTDSLTAYITRQKSPVDIDQLLPDGKAPKLCQLAASWMLSSTHCRNLFDGGALVPIPGQDRIPKRGINASVRVTRESAARFLASRRCA